MARITLASLQARLDAALSELDTQRVINQQLSAEIERLRTSKPAAPTKAAYVRPVDPLATEREAYRAYVAAKRDEARDLGVSVVVPGFAAWLETVA